MNLNEQKVKLSVLLREGVHQRIKMASALRRESIQKIMEEAAEAFLGPPGTSTREENPLDQLPEPTMPEIRAVQEAVKRIMQSGDKTAIISLKTSIEAILVLIRQRQSLPAPSGENSSDSVETVARTG